MSASNFDLSIEALDSGRYRATVVDSPAGTGSVEFASPFTFEDLAQFNDVISGRGGVDSAAQNEAIRKFGETLFAAIFVDSIKYAYTTSQTRSGASGVQVRMRLDRAGMLASVPWELLRDPAGPVPRVIRLAGPAHSHSIGGLRETLSGARLVALAAALLVIIVASIGVVNVLHQPDRDVDLIVSSLGYLPRHPAPGQIVTVSLVMRNIGTSDSGPFKWAWFRGDPGDSAGPDVVDRVSNLPPGGSYTARTFFSFGWWGQEMNSTAWVNFDNEVKETNVFNNLNRPGSGFIAATDDPFVFDFTVFPNGTLIQEPKDLKGDEFKIWNFDLKVDRGTDGRCALAIPKIAVNTEGNELVTGLSGTTPTGDCTNLPIQLSYARAIGSVSVVFDAVSAGSFQLTLTDTAGKPVVAPVSQNATQPGKITLTLPKEGGPPFDAARGPMTVTVRGSSGTSIEQMTISKPAESP